MVHAEDEIPDPNKAIFISPGAIYMLSIQKHEVVYIVMMIFI